MIPAFTATLTNQCEAFSEALKQRTHVVIVNPLCS